MPTTSWLTPRFSDRAKKICLYGNESAKLKEDDHTVFEKLINDIRYSPDFIDKDEIRYRDKGLRFSKWDDDLFEKNYGAYGSKNKRAEDLFDMFHQDFGKSTFSSKFTEMDELNNCNMYLKATTDTQDANENLVRARVRAVLQEICTRELTTLQPKAELFLRGTCGKGKVDLALVPKNPPNLLVDRTDDRCQLLRLFCDGPSQGPVMLIIETKKEKKDIDKYVAQTGMSVLGAYMQNTIGGFPLLPVVGILCNGSVFRMVMLLPLRIINSEGEGVFVSKAYNYMNTRTAKRGKHYGYFMRIISSVGKCAFDFIRDQVPQLRFFRNILWKVENDQQAVQKKLLEIGQLQKEQQEQATELKKLRKTIEDIQQSIRLQVHPLQDLENTPPRYIQEPDPKCKLRNIRSCTKSQQQRTREVIR